MLRHNLDTDEITGVETWGVFFEYEPLDAYNMAAALLCFRLEHSEIYDQFLRNVRDRLYRAPNEEWLGPVLFPYPFPGGLGRNEQLFYLRKRFPHYEFTPFLPD